MAIRVDTRHYVIAHGEKPSGTGLWIFDVRLQTKEPHVWPTAYMCGGSHASALARAKRLVRRDFKVTAGTLVLLP